ncbi:MAG: flagellar basal body-associated FliL family protein [Gammaproteobacteria bacterium]
MKKIIIFAVAGIVLVGGGIGGAMFFLKSPDESKDGEMAEEEIVEEVKEAIYEDIHPAFTVNFNEGSKKNFMQVYMVAKFYDMEARDKFKMHIPVVRNNLLLLMSGKNSDELATVEAKEMLRKSSLMTAQSVMQDIYGENLVEDIYFTKLVMQ